MMINSAKKSVIAAIGLACIALTACEKETPADAVEPGKLESQAAEAMATMLPKSESPDGAKVFFTAPENGAVLASPVKIEFGIEGMTVVPAGDNQPHSGHHHLLINTDLPNPDLPIPADASHIHFGDGSTSTEISLEPGEYTLQMLLGDYLHIPHDPPVVSQPITITVE